MKFTNILSTQKKLFFMFLIVALLPLLTLGVISYMQSTKVVNGKLSNYNQFSGEKIKTELNQILVDMYYGTAAIQQYLADNTSINLKHQKPETYWDFKVANNLERLLQAHEKSNIRGIYVITSSGYYYGNYSFKVDQFKKLELWKRGFRSGNTEIGIYKPNHYRYNDLQYALGLLVPLKFSYGVLNDSFLFIETDLDSLFDSMNLLEEDLHSRITIRDETGKLLYQTKSDEQDLKDDVVWKEYTHINNWELEIRVPRDAFYQSSNVIFKIVLIGILVAFFLALILSYIFSNQFTKRILNLKFAMEEVSKGVFEKKVSFHTKDEIGKLGLHFNRMVDRIKQLMEEVRQKELMKREAEMKAIHYQINPHLLFNTLNTIQWKARLDGNEEIGKMLLHLTKVLEGNLDFTIELIPLKKEIEAIKHFLIIQELRFGSHFTFSLKMDDRIEQGLIPRMTIQPMLENIFFHAFEDGKGNIELEITRTKGYFQLALKDNGKGMSQDKLNTLFLKPNEKVRGGIGLSNVKQKFYIHYGNDYLISVNSAVNQGTVISISWPIRWGGHYDE
ncbi:sensor histidine kinase [Cytobacillus praedii]|uniref:sensor histidine kinase n=1 Tax=Cytobacillus praedii TaxID=1742358 RepID=UPI002E1EB187|nr:sensor histidine kinase [Cytobacillus praedii]MED3572945.1 sensor histidine kinase [Cytobacillus praedii]